MFLGDLFFGLGTYDPVTTPSTKSITASIGNTKTENVSGKVLMVVVHTYSSTYDTYGFQGMVDLLSGMSVYDDEYTTYTKGTTLYDSGSNLTVTDTSVKLGNSSYGATLTATIYYIPN